MFTSVFEGKNFGYSIDNETGVYLLFSPKFKITLQLKGDNAKRFAEHIELLKRTSDDTLNERIEKTICIYLYFSSLGITGDAIKTIPIFQE